MCGDYFPESVGKELEALGTNSIGYLYLLDFYESPCSHGERVEQVVKKILTFYGADKLIQNIKRVELSALYAPDQTKQEIEKFASIKLDKVKEKILRDYDSRLGFVSKSRTDVPTLLCLEAVLWSKVSDPKTRRLYPHLFLLLILMQVEYGLIIIDMAVKLHL
ncbi:MAG: hypothetical protein U5K72_16000 [Balneolaceae bacterium]|nr:hypothetical protein [Balneolaceae bacterium]